MKTEISLLLLLLIWDRPVSAENENASIVASYIQVRLSVQNKICGSLSPPYNASYFLSDVVPGSSLFKVMEQAEPLGFSFYYTTDPTYGAYITTVNGLYANSILHQYWALIDGWTGAYLPLGASSYQPKDGDNILFKLDLF